MLSRLYISNIVLIDRLELDFNGGLSVLTGETGAGKSILLDALALALGAKADAGLIRAGTAAATVIAEFTRTDGGEAVLLKRVISTDGKSKCYINDEPATQKSLKELGDEMVEIHGQFANHSLLDEKTHIHSLDMYGQYPELLDIVKNKFAEYRDAAGRLKELRELLQKSADEREFLEHNVHELESLKPQKGEETALADMRAQMMGAEKNAGILKDAAAILEQSGLADKAYSAAHVLERTKSYQKEIDRLYEIGGAIEEIAEAIKPDGGFDVADLESAEERLFALRAAARKHRVAVDELPETLEKLRGQLGAIDGSEEALAKLEKEVKAKKTDYDNFAGELTQERIAAAADLREEIRAELPDLKLGQADFSVDIRPGAESKDGSDEAAFMIRTNPGQPFAPIGKTASGGELARFMLALRVALAGDGDRTLIFDEVDTGISGATAAAVGARLSGLSARQQIIVITHSAQVAGFADTHFLIAKHTDGKTTVATVNEIRDGDRLNEIARIISGAKITGDALSAAKALMKR